MTQPQTTDQLLAAISTLSEDDALGLVQAIARKHDWAIAIWTMGDVVVTDEGTEIEETDVPLHLIEREAVAATWEWRKGIADAAGTRVGEAGLIPTIERHYHNPAPGDGDPIQVGFTVHTDFGSTLYDMGGNVHK